jgi:hypothetical protein
VTLGQVETAIQHVPRLTVDVSAFVDAKPA